LSIHEHYTDTGGATDDVFGLCHLLGFRFVPRLRDLKDRRLATMVSLEVPSSLAPLMGRPIRVDVVSQGWDEVLHLAASLKAGTVAPSVMLKKLNAYKRRNRVDVALEEIGQMERTLFTIDWLESRTCGGAALWVSTRARPAMRWLRRSLRTSRAESPIGRSRTRVTGPRGSIW
jgi:TnpA family transposase